MFPTEGHKAGTVVWVKIGKVTRPGVIIGDGDGPGRYDIFVAGRESDFTAVNGYRRDGSVMLDTWPLLDPNTLIGWSFQATQGSENTFVVNDGLAHATPSPRQVSAADRPKPASKIKRF